MRFASRERLSQGTRVFVSIQSPESAPRVSWLAKIIEIREHDAKILTCAPHRTPRVSCTLFPFDYESTCLRMLLYRRVIDWLVIDEAEHAKSPCELSLALILHPEAPTLALVCADLSTKRDHRDPRDIARKPRDTSLRRHCHVSFPAGGRVLHLRAVRLDDEQYNCCFIIDEEVNAAYRPRREASTVRDGHVEGYFPVPRVDDAWPGSALRNDVGHENCGWKSTSHQVARSARYRKIQIPEFDFRGLAEDAALTSIETRHHGVPAVAPAVHLRRATAAACTAATSRLERASPRSRRR